MLLFFQLILLLMLMLMLILPVYVTACPPLMVIVQPWFEPLSKSFLLGKSKENLLEDFKEYVKTVLTFNIVEKLLLILIPE